MLTPEALSELQQLRRRAYGPAEGGLNASEIARLRELEEHARPRLRPLATDSRPERAMHVDDAEVDPDASSPRLDGSGDAVPAAAAAQGFVAPLDAVAAIPSAPTPAATPWWRRRAIWIAVGAGLLAGLALAWGVARAQSPPPTIVLHPTEGDAPASSAIGWSSGLPFDQESMQRFESWHGIDVWTATRGDGASCLIVLAGDVDSQTGWFSDLGCVQDGLSPQIDMWIWPGMGELIDVELRRDSNVRLVARNGVVDVWVQEAPEPTT